MTYMIYLVTFFQVLDTFVNLIHTHILYWFSTLSASIEVFGYGILTTYTFKREDYFGSSA